MKFTAAGDLLVQRRMPAEYDGFKEIKSYIEKGDARFVNLETTLNYEGECYASQYSGGTYLRANPEILEYVKNYGFNMLSFANNHTMDFSYEGLQKTLEHIRKFGIVNSGVGENLSRAAAPDYLETNKGRIALISVTTSFNPAEMAGEQSRRVKGRPGVNGLRFDETIIVTKEQMNTIMKVAEETAVNAQRDIVRAEGYLLPVPDGCFDFGDIHFKVGEKARRVTSINKTDMARIEKAIYEAKLQADYIIVSVHSHQIEGTSKENPASFLEDFAHKCIDNGVHAVIGHGPHLLRPIEIYKGKPIYYSLGDFALQLENAAFAPEDFYATYGLTSNATMHELFKTRSNDFTRGLMTDKRMFETIIPYWEMEDGNLTKLELMPVELGFEKPRSQSGLARPATDLSFVKRLAEMSEPYGVKMKIKGGIVMCEWK